MSHSYEWFSKYRPTAKQVSDHIQKRKTEKKEFCEIIKERNNLRKQIIEINDRLKVLHKEISQKCPHNNKYHELIEEGREDDYGSYEPGMDSTLKCNRCEQLIAKWGTSGNFFGVDTTGKSRYGPALEYYNEINAENNILIKATFPGNS